MAKESSTEQGSPAGHDQAGEQAGAGEQARAGERGSAGVEMVIVSFMLLVFLLAPLMCFLFEVYAYGIHSLRWMTAVENTLDQLEWQLETEALSETGRHISQETARQVLETQFHSLTDGSLEESWTLETCRFTEGNPPLLEVDLAVRYEPSTVVGLLLAQSGELQFNISRVREFPYDR